jgi:5'-3' exonuclease
MVSPNESDVLCAKLVKCGYVDACLSEDMDIIIYGCKMLIKSCDGKYFVYIYDNILKSLDITSNQLCFFASLLGCDYSRSANTKINPIELLNLCKNNNFDLKNILDKIIVKEIHSKFFGENDTNFSLSDLAEYFLSDEQNNNFQLMNNINKYYNSAYELLKFYNDDDINQELIQNSFKNNISNEILNHFTH